MKLQAQIAKLEQSSEKQAETYEANKQDQELQLVTMQLEARNLASRNESLHQQLSESQAVVQEQEEELQLSKKQIEDLLQRAAAAEVALESERTALESARESVVKELEDALFQERQGQDEIKSDMAGLVQDFLKALEERTVSLGAMDCIRGVFSQNARVKIVEGMKHTLTEGARVVATAAEKS